MGRDPPPTDTIMMSGPWVHGHNLCTQKGGFLGHLTKAGNPFQSPPLPWGGLTLHQPQKGANVVETSVNQSAGPFFCFFFEADSGHLLAIMSTNKKKVRENGQEKSPPFTLLPAVCVVCWLGLAWALPWHLHFRSACQNKKQRKATTNIGHQSISSHQPPTLLNNKLKNQPPQHRQLNIK